MQPSRLSSVTTPCITRFAPSPTGYLHLGHLAHMLYLWGVAEMTSAQVVLRIEDHDTQRCRSEYIDAIFEDLDFFGFEWNNTIQGVVHDPIQSNRDAIFEKYFHVLQHTQLVYGCNCSRKMIDERTDRVNGEICYDGFCKNELVSDPDNYRVVVKDNDVQFHDILCGTQVQNPKHQCGDFLIRDRYKQWSYNFTVTIDDLYQNINLVVRGEDLLHAAGRQIVLAEELGRVNQIHFMHHPVIKERSGKKLSKRFFAESLKEMRLAGMSREVLFGRAAYAAGLTKNEMQIRSGDIAGIVADAIG